MWRFAIFSSLFFVMAPSYAAIITFDDILMGGESAGMPPPYVYTEDGITFSGEGGDLGYLGNSSAVHLDDFGTGQASTLIVTADTAFTPVEMELARANDVKYDYEMSDRSDSAAPPISGTIDAEGVLLRGYRDGAVVAEDWFAASELTLYEFDSSFASIDRLEIIAEGNTELATQQLEDEHPSHTVISLMCASEIFPPCSHFDVNAIVIDTTPSDDSCPDNRPHDKHHWKYWKHWKHWGKHKSWGNQNEWSRDRHHPKHY